MLEPWSWSWRRTRGERELFSSWLEASGVTVLACPGPLEPDYTCVGGREGGCPLADAADVVVLDMGLDSEALMTGTAAEALLGLYLTSSRPVVTLGSRGAEEIPGELIRLRRHPSRRGPSRSIARAFPVRARRTGYKDNTTLIVVPFPGALSIETDPLKARTLASRFVRPSPWLSVPVSKPLPSSSTSSTAWSSLR